MEDTNEYTKARLKKLEEYREAGFDPYAISSFDADTHAAEIHAAHAGATPEALEAGPVAVKAAGRVIMMRKFGKAAFAHIQDVTGRIQVYFQRDALGDEYAFAKKLDIGDIIGVHGTLFLTKTGELTVAVTRLTLLSKSLRPLPEKWHGLKDIELRYRQRYVDLIVNPEVKDVFRKRSAIIKSIRDFLEAEGFMEVETPMMQPIAGGATARPFKTHHNALDMDLFLRIAPELYLKRLLVGGFERVFELNRNFRNEGISTKHNPEFSMLEFYVAYRDYNWLMDFTERMIPHVAGKALGTLRITYGEHEIDLTPPWKRLPMLEALRDRAGMPEDALHDLTKASAWARGKGIKVEKKMSLGKVLDEVFSEFIEPSLIQPTFVTDYPVHLSPLAKRKASDPTLTDRFELFIAGREIANAFSELNDPLDQRRRFEEQVKERAAGDDEIPEMDEDFVRALEYAMPPAAGEGIGIDRLVMLLTNSHSIRDVLLFPQQRQEG